MEKRLRMIEIIHQPESLLIRIEDREYCYPAESVYLDMLDETRVLLRETTQEPLTAGNVLWDLPRNLTVIRHLAS